MLKRFQIYGFSVYGKASRPGYPLHGVKSRTEHRNCRQCGYLFDAVQSHLQYNARSAEAHPKLPPITIPIVPLIWLPVNPDIGPISATPQVAASLSASNIERTS